MASDDDDDIRHSWQEPFPRRRKLVRAFYPAHITQGKIDRKRLRRESANKRKTR